jgi:site-specific DNA-cytosine methylase
LAGAIPSERAGAPQSTSLDGRGLAPVLQTAGVREGKALGVAAMTSLHPEPAFRPIPAKAVIPGSAGTRSQRIKPWIGSDRPAATICATDAGYELMEARISPGCQSYRLLTGQERKRHLGRTRVDPERPCPAILRSTPRSSTTGLIHPYMPRHLTISEIKALSSFPAEFRIEGRFVDKWGRVGNSVPPLFMRAIAAHIRDNLLARKPSAR